MSTPARLEYYAVKPRYEHRIVGYQMHGHYLCRSCWASLDGRDYDGTDVLFGENKLSCFDCEGPLDNLCDHCHRRPIEHAGYCPECSDEAHERQDSARMCDGGSGGPEAARIQAVREKYGTLGAL